MIKPKISLTEFGFLLAIFTAPWGPVIRYAGWLLAIIGLAIDKRKGHSFRGFMDPMVSWSLMLLIISAFGVSFGILQDSLHSWGRGFSLVLEFAFAIWLAAYVLKEPGAIKRWKYVWLAGITLSIFQLISGELSLFPERLFSNINTIGIYLFIILPFVLAMYFECESSMEEWLLGGLFYVCLFCIVLSFSSSAWVGVFVALMIQFLVSPFPLSKLKVLGLLLLIFLPAGILVFYYCADSYGTDLVKLLEREVCQLFSFHDLDQFTTHRIHIWKGSLEMFMAKPLTGWGWGNFSDLFVAFHESSWDVSLTHMDVHIYCAHSMYLNLAVLGGIPALGIVLWIYLRCGWNSLCNFRIGDRDKYLYCAIFSSIAGQLVYGIAGDVFSFRPEGAILFWTLLGIAALKKREVCPVNIQSRHF